jgi:putative membrane protein
MISKLLGAFPLVMLAVLAFIHAVFAYKEIFDWERSAVDVIGMTAEEARASATVGKNQGLSNAFLAAGAAWAFAAWWFRGPSAGRPLATFFASCALTAGVFGWATFRKEGFLIKQALPGALALLSAWTPDSMALAAPRARDAGDDADRRRKPDPEGV